VGHGQAGRLVVVGTGIRTTGQLTVEAIAWMKAADVLFHIVADPVAHEVIALLRPDDAIDLRQFYDEGKPRRESYEAMSSAIIAEVQLGNVVCVALYGHPGVFARAPHLAVERARALGFQADMFPAVSAEDCLFAELLIDPGDGCAQYEATNFLQHDHAADPTIHLLLWQIGMLGDWTHRENRDPQQNMVLLVEKLSTWYPLDHVVTMYQASVHLNTPPRADQIELQSLPTAWVGASCTLYVPPARAYVRDDEFASRIERVT
jgi:hypothetical protein